MPPRTRTTKVPKGLKENIDTTYYKSKAKAVAKVSNVVRKPLADKTNSASDDNGSIEVTDFMPKKSINSRQKPDANDKARPRRERRAPTRFIEGATKRVSSPNQENVHNTSQGKIKLTNQDKAPTASHGKRKSSKVQTPKSSKTDTESTTTISSSLFKSPQDINNSLVANRPKRIQRLPSKFEDHSISPSKFIPVQPCFASTPIGKQVTAKEHKTTPVQKVTENYISNKPKRPMRNRKVQKSSPVQKKPESNDLPTRRQICQKTKQNNGRVQKPTAANHSPTKRTLKSKDIELALIADTNNNPKNKSPAKNVKDSSPKKAVYSKLRNTQEKRIINKSFSFRVLEEKQRSPKNPEEKLAVYDFTFDPNEEPPQKKKRNRVIRKKGPPKPRVVKLKNNYETNLAKNLASLKQAVNKRGPKTMTQSDKVALPTIPEQNKVALTNEEASNIPRRASFAAIPDLDIMDYSPVASPDHSRPLAKMSNINETRDQIRATRASSLRPENHDPLNLLDEMSFFDEVPVASSSMNTSVRHPTASPWRVEFNNLPIKWQSNTYVKPNMTPAVECSFINLSEKKKHVYTNILPETNTSVPVAPPEPENKMMQPTIIDFMREMAEKSLNKKRNKHSLTPSKNTTDQPTNKTPNKNDTTNNATPPPIENMSPLPPPSNSSISTMSDDGDNSDPKQTLLKRKNLEEPSVLPAKSPHLEANTENCFGFDDSENQENVSPRKVDKQRVRALRPRSRAILSEINAITGPLRAKIPLEAKNKFAPTSEVVNKLFDEMKASNVPGIVDKEKDKEVQLEKDKEVAPSDVSDPSWQESALEDTDSQSVHLFEDVDLVHHLKPVRKSYCKPKKVTFCQKSDCVAQETADHNEDDSEEEEDPLDLPFQVPTIKQKKVTSKKKKKGIKLTKKEEEEVEAWAAAFNSMCEDVDEFALVLE